MTYSCGQMSPLATVVEITEQNKLVRTRTVLFPVFVLFEKNFCFLRVSVCAVSVTLCFSIQG